MGIQSSTNKVLKDLGVLAQEKEQENLQLDKEVTAYKRDVLKYRKSALELQNAKLAEKKAAFEKSLIFSFFSSASISGHGAKTRSQ